MMVVFHLLFFAFHILSSRANSTRVPNHFTFEDDIEWLQIDRSVLVRLETPNIPLYVWDKEKETISPTVHPSAVVLNFTLSHDHRTLLIQDQPFLPLPNPSTPSLLQAYQVPAHEPAPLTDPKSNIPPFSLDYDRQVYPRDDSSIQYYNYRPTVLLDILGAGTQKTIGITLKDSNSFPTQNPPNPSFQIIRVWLVDRLSHEPQPVYMSRRCGLWSYRCADFSDAPWYRYVSKQDFDEHGRIGSMRHFLVKRWRNLCVNVGFTRFIIFTTVVAGVTLWYMAHRIYRCVRRARARYIAQKAELVDWLADEEEGDVLLSDHDFLQRERRFKESQEAEAWSRLRHADTFSRLPENPNIYGSSEKL